MDVGGPGCGPAPLREPCGILGEGEVLVLAGEPRRAFGGPILGYYFDCVVWLELYDRFFHVFYV